MQPKMLSRLCSVLIPVPRRCPSRRLNPDDTRIKGITTGADVLTATGVRGTLARGTMIMEPFREVAAQRRRGQAGRRAVHETACVGSGLAGAVPLSSTRRSPIRCRPFGHRR
jgi:hypothetical protein